MMTESASDALLSAGANFAGFVHPYIGEITEQLIDEEPKSTYINQEAMLRNEFLTRCFFEYSRDDAPTDSEALNEIKQAFNLRLIINELAQLRPTSQAELDLSEKRDDLVGAMKLSARARRRNPEREIDAEKTYVESVLSKVEAHIDSQTAEAALELLHIPILLKKASFNEDTVLTEEELAANHLAVLMDIMLKEHVKLREAAFENTDGGLFSRLLRNRVFRIGTATLIFGLSLVPKLNIVPTPEEEISERIELGLKILTALILGVELPRIAGEKITRSRSRTITKKRIGNIAADKALCDLALMTTYNSTRYGKPEPGRRVTGRSATDDPVENLKRLNDLDIAFIHLNNDPGGKPYNADQALAFVSHVNVEFKHYINEIIESNGDPVRQKALFMGLSRELITKDIFYLRHRVRTGRFYKLIRGGISVIPGLMFPDATLAASEAKTIAGDTEHTFLNKRKARDDSTV